LATHDLKNFDLVAFQEIFSVQNTEDPMFAEFQITPENFSHVEHYIEGKIKWDFSSKEYFVGACAI
jgi:hypothetical protein